MFVENLHNRLINLPGMKVVSQQTETLGTAEAAHLEVVGPGTGDSFAPSGVGTPVAPKDRELEPTRSIVVAFPRPADTLVLVWHLPESANADLREEIQTVLKGLHVESPRARVSTY